MILKSSVSLWPIPWLGEDGDKKLEEHRRDLLRTVSQAVSLAGLEVSLCSMG